MHYISISLCWYIRGAYLAVAFVEYELVAALVPARISVFELVYARFYHQLEGQLGPLAPARAVRSEKVDYSWSLLAENESHGLGKAALRPVSDLVAEASLPQRVLLQRVDIALVGYYCM